MDHRKTVKHFHEVGHRIERALSCYRQVPWLTNDNPTLPVIHGYQNEPSQDKLRRKHWRSQWHPAFAVGWQPG